MSLNHRESTEQDRETIKKWLAADPVHRDLVTADFWLPSSDAEEGKGTKCITVEDEKGVAFFLRCENIMRVYVQFPPDEERDPERIKNALQRSFMFVAAGAKKLGYKSMIFDSVSKPLIQFFNKFGFKEFQNIFKVDL